MRITAFVGFLCHDKYGAYHSIEEYFALQTPNLDLLECIDNLQCNQDGTAGDSLDALLVAAQMIIQFVGKKRIFMITDATTDINDVEQLETITASFAENQIGFNCIGIGFHDVDDVEQLAGHRRHEQPQRADPAQPEPAGEGHGVHGQLGYPHDERAALQVCAAAAHLLGAAAHHVEAGDAREALLPVPRAAVAQEGERHRRRDEGGGGGGGAGTRTTRRWRRRSSSRAICAARSACLSTRRTRRG